MSVLLRAVALVLALALGLTWLLLRATAAAADDATFAAVQASLDRLDHLVAQQEDLTETFKSANAQLQNSLTYFDTISAGISQSDPAVASLIGELGTAVLHLTRDPSAPVVAQAGQLLATLDALAARTQAARAARRFQVALYLIALLLLAVLARAGWRLRAAARALERRAALEHRIAAVSTHFIGCPPDQVGPRLSEALALLGPTLAPTACTSSSPAPRWNRPRDRPGRHRRPQRRHRRAQQPRCRQPLRRVVARPDGARDRARTRRDRAGAGPEPRHSPERRGTPGGTGLRARRLLGPRRSPRRLSHRTHPVRRHAGGRPASRHHRLDAASPGCPVIPVRPAGAEPPDPAAPGLHRPLRSGLLDAALFDCLRERAR